MSCETFSANTPKRNGWISLGFLCSETVTHLLVQLRFKGKQIKETFYSGRYFRSQLSGERTTGSLA